MSDAPERLSPEVALQRLQGELQGPPYNAFLGLEAVSADPDVGRVTVRMSFRDEFMRAAGQREYHGGIISALVDATGHAAVAVWTGHQAPTIDLRVDFIAGAGAEALYAEGVLLKAGRSVGRADVTVRNASGKLIAVGRGTFSTLARG